MKFSPIAVAVAAALLSFGAVAQEKKQESQAGQSPSMSQEQKPSSGAASGGASAPAEKKAEGSAAAGASTEKKEGSAAAGAGASAKGEAQSPEIIKQVQTKLNEQGHDVGEADGKMGAKTQKGLKEFQTSKGIKATGQLDPQTLAALGVSESAAGGTSKDETKAEKKAEGSAAAGGTKPEEKKPETPAAPAKTETKPGEKKY